MKGDDTLTGLGGDDIINGGDGFDIVSESGNVNFVLKNTKLTGLGTDILSSIEAAILTGGSGNNTLNASGFSGQLKLDGGAGNDFLVGGSNRNFFTGGTGNDTVRGGASDDTIIESGNVDFVLSGNLLTGLGTDRLSSIERAILTGGSGNNVLDAIEFSGSVNLSGGAGNDKLFGGSNNDNFTGGEGNDTINGGGGSQDRLIEFGDVNFFLTDKSLTGNGTDSLSSIEQAFLTGGSGNNKLNAAGFSGLADLSGGAGNDSLTGGSNDDRLSGGAGNDTLNGGAGDFDEVSEFGDVDFVVTDTKLIGLGTDSLSNIERVDLTGGSSDNILNASDFDNINNVSVLLHGGAGNDLLLGATGFTHATNSLFGQDGNDVLRGGNNSDFLDGGAGFDQLLSAAGDDFLRGGDNNDFLTAGQGDDTLFGDAGNDTLFGADSADGSVGTIDVLTGGTGSDTFGLGISSSVFYNDNLSSGSTQPSDIDDYALIEDFNTAEDTIQLHAGVQYILGSSPISGVSGTGIFQVDSGGFSTDLIGVVQNVSGLDLRSSAFSFE